MKFKKCVLLVLCSGLSACVTPKTGRPNSAVILGDIVKCGITEVSLTIIERVIDAYLPATGAFLKGTKKEIVDDMCMIAKEQPETESTSPGDKVPLRFVVKGVEVVGVYKNTGR